MMTIEQVDTEETTAAIENEKYKVTDKRSTFFGKVGELNRAMTVGKESMIELWFDRNENNPYQGTWLFTANQVTRQPTRGNYIVSV